MELEVLKQRMNISVIIPTYNRMKYIERAVRSVLNQTYEVDEIIIVDDHSVDDTASVVSSIHDDRIKYFYLDKNVGAGQARNYGVSVAAGEWIAFHDSDDVWREYKIEKQVKYISSHNDVEFVYSSYQGGEQITPLKFNMKHYEGKMLDVLLDRNTVGAPTILMKRELFDAVGGFDKNMDALEDWDLALKIAIENKIGFVEEPLVDVFRVDESISWNPGDHINMLCYLIGKYKRYYLEYDLFNQSVLKVMDIAKRRGVEKQTEQLLTKYLSIF